MRLIMTSLAFLIAVTPWVTPCQAQSLLRVPQDDSLQGAINRISNGGVIEISAGTYAAPGGAFRIRFLGKSLTLRAVGGEVVLDGGGTTDILRIADSSPVRTIALEGLTFRNGLSTAETISGAVSVEGARVVIRGSRFESNVAEPAATGGGALRVSGGASVELSGCELVDNRSPNRGGAVAVLFSDLEVSSSLFRQNSVAVEPNTGNASGGAIYALDSNLMVQGSRFEGNLANRLGGAIYGFGTWRDPQDGQESTVVEIRDSTFDANVASPRPCCPITGGVSFGGAVHVEDQTLLRIFGSRFLDNRASRGGAINGYRTRIEVEDSRFIGNLARRDSAGDIGDNGGAIFSCSVDVPDASTDFGLINRRSAELTVRNSFFRGPSTDLPNQGGCIFADGDVARLAEGFGTLAENRTPVLIEDSVFDDCDTAMGLEGPSFGGAIAMVLADLEMSRTLISSSDALGANGVGGALANRDSSRLVLTDNHFVGNRAESLGGGLFISGAEVELAGNHFIGNEVSPGVAEPIAQSNGAALYLAPALPDGPDVSGVVRDSTFVNNVGVAILDNDRTASPFSLVRFDDNAFRESSFGNDVYKNTALGFGGFTAAELNNLVVDHTGAPDFAKSDGGNTRLASTPRFGDLVAAPAAIAGGAPGDPAGGWPAILGYAWSGGGASLGGAALNARGGAAEIETPGEYALRVDGTLVDSVSVEEMTCTGGPLLCLREDRFQLEVDWRDFAGNRGQGQVVPFGTSDSGLFYFFDEDNWELLVKVLDGCGFNGHYWIFAAATTNVEYTLNVTDTLTGLSRTYSNPLGVSSAAITDAEALAVCTVGDPADSALPGASAPDLLGTWLEEVSSFAPDPGGPDLGGPDLGAPDLGGTEPVEAVDAEPKAGECSDSSTVLCVQQERFSIEIEWRDFQGNTGSGRVVTEAVSSDSGIFYFFAEENWEVLVKVLNGCGFNDHYWVFAAATTNVEYTLTVTDGATGQSVVYRNPLGISSAAVTDAQALATCP